MLSAQSATTTDTVSWGPVMPPPRVEPSMVDYSVIAGMAAAAAAMPNPPAAPQPLAPDSLRLQLHDILTSLGRTVSSAVEGVRPAFAGAGSPAASPTVHSPGPLRGLQSAPPALAAKATVARTSLNSFCNGRPERASFCATPSASAAPTGWLMPASAGGGLSGGGICFTEQQLVGAAALLDAAVTTREAWVGGKPLSPRASSSASELRGQLPDMTPLPPLTQPLAPLLGVLDSHHLPLQRQAFGRLPVATSEALSAAVSPATEWKPCPILPSQELLNAAAAAATSGGSGRSMPAVGLQRLPELVCFDLRSGGAASSTLSSASGTAAYGTSGEPEPCECASRAMSPGLQDLLLLDVLDMLAADEAAWGMYLQPM
eukprot:SM000244S08537  [mRNA]  locus=s244:151594:152712:+ [translate_table: standard]